MKYGKLRQDSPLGLVYQTQGSLVLRSAIAAFQTSLCLHKFQRKAIEKKELCANSRLGINLRQGDFGFHLTGHKTPQRAVL